MTHFDRTFYLKQIVGQTDMYFMILHFTLKTIWYKNKIAWDNDSLRLVFISN